MNNSLGLPYREASTNAIYTFKRLIVASKEKPGFLFKLGESLKFKIEDPNFSVLIAKVESYALSNEKVEISISKVSPKDLKSIYYSFVSIWIMTLKELFFDPNNKSYFEYIDEKSTKFLNDFFHQYSESIDEIIINAFPVLDITPYRTNGCYEFEIQLY